MLARVISGLLMSAVALLLVARWMAGEAGGEGDPGAGDPPVPPAVSASAVEGAAGSGSRREEHEPPSADASPDERAARFQERVLREIRAMDASASDGAGPARSAGSAARPSPGVRSTAGSLRTSGRASDLSESRLAATGLGPEDRERVDWEYLRGVFSGRISGIPDERKAGISLQQMDALGDIPAIEALRQQERFEELRDLGFENETIPWPVCLRTGTCRRDPASSP